MTQATDTATSTALALFGAELEAELMELPYTYLPDNYFTGWATWSRYAASGEWL